MDLELGKRNIEGFVKRYKNNDNYILFKLFDKSVFSETEHVGCIVKGADRKVKKLTLFVCHPGGSMRSGSCWLNP